MMKYIIFLFISLFNSTASGNDRTSSLHGQPSAVDCEVRTVVINNGEDGHSVQYKCITYPDEEDDGEDDMVYDLPEWIAKRYRDALKVQPTNYIRIQGARISRQSHEPGSKLRQSSADRIVSDGYSTVEFSDAPLFWSGRRMVATPQKSGVSSVLFVRVTTNDGSVSLGADIISDRVFGSSATLASTYSDCSFGKLKMERATGNGITNGVIDLFVNVNIQNAEIQSLENSMSTALTAKVGSLDQFDHVAYCVPKGSYLGVSGSYSWVGYGYVSWYRSVFNDDQCGYLSSIAHEIGHNLGLGHSGNRGSEYGDQSGIMGYGDTRRTNWPVKCFNAAKNWQLGWYSDKSVIVSVEKNPWQGRLYGYSDYETADGSVLIKVGNLYLQYNKIASLNRDTVQAANQIAIIQSTATVNSKSTILQVLDASNTLYTVKNFAVSQDLVIEVCGHIKVSSDIDFFDMMIRLASQQAKCGQPLPEVQPLPSPTQSTVIASPPTPEPTMRLVVAQTPYPTNDSAPRTTPTPLTRVTSTPTNGPTVSSTKNPTPSPTFKPTQRPTNTPTISPTTFPTPLPTLSPVAPTSTPSDSPSVIPSRAPTALESASPSQSPHPTGLPSSNLICDDHPWARFPTDAANGYKRCIWLAVRPQWQKTLCVASHPAYKICEETCGACTDDCYDTGGNFVFNGVERPCSWLSLRMFVQKEVCVPDHESGATKVCPETCGTCDGQFP